MKPSIFLSSINLLNIKNIMRDPMLKWMLVIPLFYAFLSRFGFPLLFEWLKVNFHFDAIPYIPVIVSFIAMSLLSLLGIVMGFVILDEKDDQTLLALQVTPLPQSYYLTYHICLPLLLSFLFFIFLIPILGLIELKLSNLIFLATSYSTIAPIYTLMLGIFAKNKVQGFALMKSIGTGVFNIGPLIAYFIPSPWEYFFGIMPTYWPLKLLWAISEKDSYGWIYFALGMIYSCVILVYLTRNFYRLTNTAGN